MEQIAAMLAAKEIELQSKGWSPRQAQAANRRAIRWAEQLASRLPTHLQEEAMTALLGQELGKTETWLRHQQQAAADEPLSDEPLSEEESATPPAG